MTLRSSPCTLAHLLLLPSLWLAGCATTSEKIPGLGATGHWQAQLQRVLAPPVSLELSIGDLEVTRIEHLLHLERRRKHHFHPLEHRWVLKVFLSGRTATHANGLAAELAGITAVLPDGRRLELPYRGRTNEGQVKYIEVYSLGEEIPAGPVAFQIDGQRIDVPRE